MRGVERKKLKSRENAGIVFWVLVVMAVIFSRPIEVEAVPATLDSDTAVIYEQPAENSSNVGSLVRDNAFEYVGDITAEDGSVWHEVITVNGISGYIKADIQMNMTEEPEAEAPEESAGGNETTEPAAEEETSEETDPEEEEDPEEEDPEEEPEEVEEQEGEDESGEADAAPTSRIQNNRDKTYFSDGLGKRIKEQEYKIKNADGEETEAVEDSRNTVILRKVDKSLVFAIFIFLISVFTGRIFYRKLRKSLAMEDLEDYEPVGKRFGRIEHNKRSEKKKLRSRQRKRRKKNRRNKKNGKT